jgi:hypothetical protein
MRKQTQCKAQCINTSKLPTKTQAWVIGNICKRFAHDVVECLRASVTAHLHVNTAMSKHPPYRRRVLAKLCAFQGALPCWQRLMLPSLQTLTSSVTTDHTSVVCSFDELREATEQAFQKLKRRCASTKS